VLWHATQAAPGLEHLMDVLHDRDICWALLTNNATLMVEDYVEKLAGFGLAATPNQIYTSAVATAEHLQRTYPAGSAIFAIGEKGIKGELARRGFTVYEGETAPPEPVVAVVAAMDRQLTYQKLVVVSQLILAGVPFYGTNADPSYPTPAGLIPGSGSMLALLQAATGVAPIVLGKPEKGLFETAIRGMTAEPATTAMVGDRMDTDILGGKEAGLRTILVLSGVTKAEELPGFDYTPNAVFANLDELASALAG